MYITYESSSAQGTRPGALAASQGGRYPFVTLYYIIEIEQVLHYIIGILLLHYITLYYIISCYIMLHYVTLYYHLSPSLAISYHIIVAL